MRQLRSLRHRFPCRGAEADSHGLAIPQLQLLDKVIDGPVVRVVLSFRVVHMPVVCNDRCSVSFRSC